MLFKCVTVALLVTFSNYAVSDSSNNNPHTEDNVNPDTRTNNIQLFFEMWLYLSHVLHCLPLAGHLPSK